MSLEYTITVTPDRIVCKTTGLFTPEEGHRLGIAVVEACASNDCMYALIDVTGITEAHIATGKLIFAHYTAETVSHLQKMQSAIPRIAILGTAPFISSTYKPASGYFQLNNIPIRSFYELSSAEEWLFSEDT
jgi:hypothetical protein